MEKQGLKTVGWSEIIRRYSLDVLPQYCQSFITRRGRRKRIVDQHQTTEIYPNKYDPGNTLGDHLVFAFKFEGINLEILSLLFKVMDKTELEKFIKEAPSGKYARRIWFLYEFLTGEELDLDSAKATNYIDLLDSAKYYTTSPVHEKRQKINNNLMGNRYFCPCIRRTDILNKYIKLKLNEKSKEIISMYPEKILQRAISYLYTRETKSSFAIERTTVDHRQVSSFVELLKFADKRVFFNKPSLIELQQAIVDKRFINRDFRRTQNYIGQTVNPGSEIIHFVAPKPQDVPKFMEGLFYTYERMMSSELHPVIIAAVISFGFVFIHPFDDGNGRIHRFLIHNILAQKGFTPQGLIFPVSASMLRKIKDYDETLEMFSRPLMPLIDFELDSNGQMTVKNETAVHYRYIDMTAIAEKLFWFIEKTIENEVKLELDFLLNYDKAKLAIQDIMDMPDYLIDLFICVCLENNGRVSKNKRKSIFIKLTDQEIVQMERCVQKTFGLPTKKIS